MQYRTLGSTGIRVSALAFGAGPVGAVMIGTDFQRQLALVRRAVEAGINWFDTSPSYGNGLSEKSLGKALEELGVSSRVHVATKVRLMPDQLDHVEQHVRASVAGSLKRLGLPQLTLLQLHNAVTAGRGDEPASVTPHDVLRPGGILQVFETLKSEGQARHLGLTGTGQPEALREVIRWGAFETVQTPYNVLNPSVGRPLPEDFDEADLGDIISECARLNMGVFAIRVYAGGALAGNPPSEHTLKTPFFPLDLYRRDQQRAARLEKLLTPPSIALKEAAVRFVLSHPAIASAIIGFGARRHIDEALEYQAAGPLPDDILQLLRNPSLGTSGNTEAEQSDSGRSARHRNE